MKRKRVTTAACVFQRCNGTAECVPWACTMSVGSIYMVASRPRKAQCGGMVPGWARLHLTRDCAGAESVGVSRRPWLCGAEAGGTNGSKGRVASRHRGRRIWFQTGLRPAYAPPCACVLLTLAEVALAGLSTSQFNHPRVSVMKSPSLSRGAGICSADRALGGKADNLTALYF